MYALELVDAPCATYPRKNRKRCTKHLDWPEAPGEIHATELIQRLNTNGFSSRSPDCMMAFDRTPSAPTLAPTTIDSIRSALARSVAQGNHNDDLRDLLCAAADEARKKGIQAERLLVILKEIWYSLPEVAKAQSPEAENALLQELISRCIQEYYAL
jgi:hypothetical protein